MKEAIVNSSYFGVVISVAGYALGMLLKKKFKSALLNPLLIAVIFVIAVLLVFGISLDSYNVGAKYISYLLTPATVCLAIPLYRQLSLLKKYKKALSLGILSGVLASLGSIAALSFLFGLSHEQYVTLLPKSITTSIGISVSTELGGIASLTVAAIIITGLIGNMFAQSLLKLFKVEDPVAQGAAIGTSAHALGTAKALELGEIQGAMSSLSIVVAGLLTVAGASFFAMFI
jgi:predicted murein hydrolase (TIGR00659 family)